MKKIILSKVLMGLMMLITLSCSKDDGGPLPDNEQNNGDSNEPKIELSNSGKVDGYECVDLGLSVKWATCNMGAYKPEDYGYYYAWGEITTKSAYNLNNYSLYKNDSYSNLGNDISNTTHDAAYISWGNKWKMPTYNDLEELENRCSFQWVSYNDKVGCLVQGPNGNKMFLPAAGRINNTLLGWEESIVSLWGSTLWPWGTHHDLTQCESAVALSISKSENGKPGYENLSRYLGCPIRPVTTATPKTSDNDDSNGNNNNNNGGSGSSTDEPPYVISYDFSATKTSITVKFMCNERPTSATVKYGTSSPSRSTSSSIIGKQVTATVSGLKSGTKYYFNCTVKNSYGSSTSDTFTAITNY